MHRSPRDAAAATDGLGARLRKAAAITALVATAVLGGIQAAHAAYVLRYDVTTRGGVTFTGNTLGLSRDTSSSGLTQPGVRDSIGAFSTIDTTLQLGSYPPGTTDDWQLNSAAATLQLPPASSVLHAELIWGGSINLAGEDVSGDLDTPVSFIVAGSTTPVSIAPEAATAQEGGGYYVRSADVTALVQAAGAGSYVVGGVPGTR